MEDGGNFGTRITSAVHWGNYRNASAIHRGRNNVVKLSTATEVEKGMRFITLIRHRTHFSFLNCAGKC